MHISEFKFHRTSLPIITHRTAALPRRHNHTVPVLVRLRLHISYLDSLVVSVNRR